MLLVGYCYGIRISIQAAANNRRFRSYGWAKKEPLVQAKLTETSGLALAYRMRRAEKKGVTLRRMILSSFPRDSLEMLIDKFLFAAGQAEGMLTVTERGTECLAPNSIAQYQPPRLRSRPHEKENDASGHSRDDRAFAVRSLPLGSSSDHGTARHS